MLIQLINKFKEKADKKIKKNSMGVMFTLEEILKILNETEKEEGM